MKAVASGDRSYIITGIDVSYIAAINFPLADYLVVVFVLLSLLAYVHMIVYVCNIE